MTLTYWLNTAWMWSCGSEGRAFRHATRHVAQTQYAVLKEILAANRRSQFGERHGFRRMGSPEEFQQAVALSSYDDYAGAVERIAAGQRRVLTTEPVQLLEPTSGTTAGVKLIPYTAALRRQFQRGIAAWIDNLFRARPAVRTGRAYWSISPAFGTTRYSSGGIPIGFAADADYLGRWNRAALEHVLVAPAALAQISDFEAFRYCTLSFLLGAGDLSLISIWNPTFLTSLVASLERWCDRLCHDLRRGTITPPAEIKHEVAERISVRLRPNPARAAELAAIFRTIPRQDELFRAIWPKLALISCWTDAAASIAAMELAELFPHTEIQPKGLLATEGFVSFPLVDQPGAALALRSHFFEFLESGSSSQEFRHRRLAHQLDHGGRYRVVITTGGGLYRYSLHDEVEVVGFLAECPLLRFLGKTDHTCDLVGEKVAETHVRQVLERELGRLELEPRFVLLAPIMDRPPHYRLYVQLHVGSQDMCLLKRLRDGIERGLCENPHYRYAIGLAQLAEMDLHLLQSDGESGGTIYQQQCVLRGQRAGSVKPTALDSWRGWPEVFEQHVVAVAAATNADRPVALPASPAKLH
jgi:hypothetical protein